MTTVSRLHLGCGNVIHPGWINIDVRPYPGVDRVLDVRGGLPFENVDYIFAEHFLEHFTFPEGVQLLAECRRVLSPGGILRLTTPNLDWVWITSYSSRWQANGPTHAAIDLNAWNHDARAAGDCVSLNRAFHGWGHRFLYNTAMLTHTLLLAGFGQVEWTEYGKSRHSPLQDLERHEKYQDTPELPHLLVVESFDTGGPEPHPELSQHIAELVRDTAIG
jgi:predicted SAM-dependent methyltransferase